jgi:hypothetical protein
MKYKLIPIMLSALLVAACDNKESTDNASPSLSEVTSSEAVKKAAESTMSKGDPSKPLSEYREIKSGNDLMFLYQGMLNLPVDYDKIAEVYSDDYRITQDAFKKQDIISALKDRINGQIDAAKNSRYIVWVNSSPYSSILQSYDMKNKSFTVKDWDPESYWYWNDNASRYHLAFSNATQFQKLPVSDESKARDIEGIVSKGKGMKMRIYAYVQDADPSNTTVKAEIMKVEVTGLNGEPIYP